MKKQASRRTLGLHGLSRFLAIWMVFALLFTNISFSKAECNHDWDFKYDTVNNYEVVDDTYHKIVSTTIYYVCNLCGEERIETQDASEQYKGKHNFNSKNICYDCGYKREEEKHEHDWETEYDEENNYKVVDATYHKIVSVTLYYICYGCGERKTETYPASDQYKSKHNFNSKNVCYDCGYKKQEEEKHEHEWKLEFDEENNYKAVDATYHKIVSVTLYYICYGCGERQIETYPPSSHYKSEHNFSSENVCYECGYKREEEKHEHDWDFEYSPEYEYAIVDENYHKIISTTLYYICDGCNERKTETQYGDGPLSSHSFNSNNICTTCGYKKIIVTPTPTTAPTATPTPTPNVEPTKTPTPVTPAPTVLPTELPASTPEAVHTCVAGEPTLWIGAYRQYSETLHTRQRVVTTYCVDCGKVLDKTNTTEYVNHIFNNGVCTKCNFKEILASKEDKEYATKRIDELKVLIGLANLAVQNGDVLMGDFNKTIDDLAQKIAQLTEVVNGTRRLSTIQESTFNVDYAMELDVMQKLTSLGYSKIKSSQMVAYYQIVNGLEVTGWITEETYFSILHNLKIKTEISKHLANVEKLKAKELVDLIGSGIKFIQENKENKEACDIAYSEIEILLKNLKKTPEYINNRNLKDIDWIFKVDEGTPGFKDIVDLAFSKENIFSNKVGSLPKDYLDQYTEQYIANTLTVIDGAIIITVGGAIAYEAVTTGGVALTIGSTVIPVAGYSATQWESAVDYAMNNIDTNRANNHIMQSSHLWDKLVTNPTWEKIYPYIERVLLYGENTGMCWNENLPAKKMIIDNYAVYVQYTIIDGIIKIVDATVDRRF